MQIKWSMSMKWLFSLNLEQNPNGKSCKNPNGKSCKMLMENLAKILMEKFK